MFTHTKHDFTVCWYAEGALYGQVAMCYTLPTQGNFNISNMILRPRKFYS